MRKITIRVETKQSIGSIWHLFFFTGYLRRGYLACIVKKEIDIIRTEQPDFIFTEMDPAIFIAAKITGIRLISTYASIATENSDNLLSLKALKLINSILKEHNMPCLKNVNQLISDKSIIKIIPSIPQLERAHLIPLNSYFLGNITHPVHNYAPLFRIDRRKKYIFCYPGTGSITPEKYQKILQKCMIKFPDMIAIITGVNTIHAIIQDNVILCSYINAELILPYCTVVICHGGLNTITQSLSHGVPLLMFPGAIFERKYNAMAVEKINCGYCGKFSDFNENWICEKIEYFTKPNPIYKKIKYTFKKYRGFSEIDKIIFKKF